MTIEPITKETVEMIKRQFGFGAIIARIGDVDVTKGCGILGPGHKCLWTKDRCRIDIISKNGTLIATCGKEPDPECPR